MQGFAKYIVGVSRLASNDEEAISAVQAKLAELVRATLEEVLTLVQEPAKQWGEVARSTNKITGEIEKSIREKMKV